MKWVLEEVNLMIVTSIDSKDHDTHPSYQVLGVI